jgi:hypothetical protein
MKNATEIVKKLYFLPFSNGETLDSKLFLLSLQRVIRVK